MTEKEELTAAEIRRRARAFLAREFAGGNVKSGSAALAESPIVRKPWMLREIIYMPAKADRSYAGYGFAKVAYPDQWDLEEGTRLVTERAIKDLAFQLIAAGEYCGQDIPLD